MNTNFDDVQDMYYHFGLVENEFSEDRPPHLLSNDMMVQRMKHLREEILELSTAYDEGNLVEAADGLVDLVVIAMGTAALMNLPWEELWREVHRSNMSKRRGTAQESKRDYATDLIKGLNYKPPEIAQVLYKAGWKQDNFPEES